MNGESTLSISKVRREFLNVPFRCHVVSPADREIGLLYLQEGIVCSLGFLNIRWRKISKKIAPLIITISISDINRDRLESVLVTMLCLFLFI